MDKIKSFFDDFTFQARVMPIIVVLIPVIIIGINNGIVQDGWSGSIILVFTSIAVLTITSKIARNFGKEYERKMYEKLGGMPTTIVQRFTDNTFDDVTKQRYHKIMNQFDGLKLPLCRSDETSDDDQQYISAANILRNYANSNRDKELRVYQELKEYNFWRNLYGIKKIALALYLLIFAREIFIKGNFSIKALLLYPYPEYVNVIVVIMCVVFMLLFLNQKVVEQKAFDYAKTLIEVCERISVDTCKNVKK